MYPVQRSYPISKTESNKNSLVAKIKKELAAAEEIHQVGLGNLHKQDVCAPSGDSEEDGVPSTKKKKMARISGGRKSSDEDTNEKLKICEERMNLKERQMQQKEDTYMLLLQNHAESLELKKQQIEILQKQQENVELEKK
jgi:hypothetical protein